MRTLENNNCGLEEENDEDMDVVDMDVDNGEEVVDENIIESKLYWQCIVLCSFGEAIQSRNG